MKTLLFYASMLFLLLPTGTLMAQTFVKRINCGSGTSESYNGNVYESDASASGVTFDGELQGSFALTLAEPLKSIRYTKNTDREMFYNITVPQAGQYEVNLYFAEPYWGVSSSGNGHDVRVFDVLIEGVLVADNVDVVQSVGPHAVYTINHTAQVNDGVLTLEFDAEPGKNDPIINAIEVLEVSSSDTTPPAAPTLSSTGNTDTTADLSWSGATDNVGVTGYKIIQDGSEIASIGNVSTYQVTGLTEQTGYTFTVKAVDAAANESVASNAASVTTNATNSGGGVWNSSGNTINYTAGNVGVKALAQTNYALAVGGKIISEEVKVQLQANWPDYVFKSDYKLPSLEELRQHIQVHGYLPNMPSAAQVEADGLEIGEMNRLLLEKIEELTLYILEQDNQLKDYQKLNKDLMLRVEKIEAKNPPKK